MGLKRLKLRTARVENFCNPAFAMVLIRHHRSVELPQKPALVSFPTRPADRVLVSGLEGLGFS